MLPSRPYGTFVGVSAAADDRTFVLAAQKLVPYFPPNEAKPPVPATKFFLLRLHPGRRRPGTRATLTPLNVPVIPGGTAVSDFALSPDGSRLALVAGPADVRRPYLQNLSVYNLAAGTQRNYHPAGAGSPYIGDNEAVPITPNTLSWGADSRTLAVDVEQIHWMSPSGRVLLVTDALRGRHHSKAHFADVDAGMIEDGRYTPLPWSENTFTAAW